MVALWDTAPVKAGSKDLLHFVAKIPSQNGKISSCIFLESKTRVSVESEGEEEGPPRIALGEYQSMHIWQITAPASLSFAQSTVSRILSLPSCQEGVVCCLDAAIVSLGDTNEDDPFLVLSSASGSQENNLKLWTLRPSEPTFILNSI